MPTVLVWVQHLLGSGHLRRALSLAEVLAEAGIPVVVASGGFPQPWTAANGVQLVQLEPLRSADSSFRVLEDAQGRPVTEAVWALRHRQLLACLEQADPALVVTEMFPFGRGAFRSEVTALLAAARARRPGVPIVASVRDVLVTPVGTAKVERMLGDARRWYDRILVHGDARLIPFEASFPRAVELGDLIGYTGYLTTAAPPRPAVPRTEVLVTAGGGRVGGLLLETALAARTLTRLASRPWRLVTGTGLPELEVARLREAAPPGVVIDRHHASLAALLRRAIVSVSQAGYNTVVEALEAAAPMVLVPFAASGEDEQSIRAARLAELGMALVVEEGRLSPESLAHAVDAAAMCTRPAIEVALDGARVAADTIASLLRDLR